MSVLRGSCSEELPSPRERCWTLVADIERAPEWQRTLERVDVRERDDQGRPVICDTVTNAKLTKIHARVRIDYDPPQRLSFTLLESDHLDAMEGGWELEDLGAQRTRATYSLAVDPGPVGLLARPLERAIRPVVMGHQAQELGQALAAGTR
ncbi:MAG: SRPBCC family protein [Actinomycetota bacterium]|nr:SRPBCC family protein [Actinomycetota bacterium]